MNSMSPPVLQLEINDVTRAWGLEVDRVELAVEAVLQQPQDSPAGSSLDSTLQQLALHLLGGGMNPVAGSTPSAGPGEEPGEEGEGAVQFGMEPTFATCSKHLCTVHTLPVCLAHADPRESPS